MVKSKSRGRTYDKCLLNIPINLYKDPLFPFKGGDPVEIIVEPELKTMFLTQQPELWQELIETSKEIAKNYMEMLERIDSDPSLTRLQKSIAKVYYENIVKEKLPEFLFEKAKEAFEYAKSK